MKKEKICCFITNDLCNFVVREKENCISDGKKEALKKELERLIEEDGVTTFLTALEAGYDLFCAKHIAEIKEEKGLSLISYLAFEGQQKDYGEEELDDFYYVASCCDKENLLFRNRIFGGKNVRDLQMIDKSDILLVFWDSVAPYTAPLIKEAGEKGKKIILADPFNDSSLATFKQCS